MLVAAWGEGLLCGLIAFLAGVSCTTSLPSLAVRRTVARTACWGGGDGAWKRWGPGPVEASSPRTLSRHDILRTHLILSRGQYFITRSALGGDVWRIFLRAA